MSICGLLNPLIKGDLGAGSETRAVQRLRPEGPQALDDLIANERAIAMVYNGISHAVMMASPLDLYDFGLGFSLTEGILSSADELYAVDVITGAKGLELNMQISSRRFSDLKRKRRVLTGMSSCGICGSESLDAAIRDVPRVGDSNLLPELCFADILSAVEDFQAQQVMRSQTGALHAAAWCAADGETLCVREDIGRHNAVDKVIGALQTMDWNPVDGFLLLSSRISYEIILKAAAVGMANVVAASAPTTLAIEQADQAGICLAGRLSADRLTVYSRVNRVSVA